MNLVTLLIILLVIPPRWRAVYWVARLGWGPSGIVGIVLIVLVVLLLMGRI